MTAVAGLAMRASSRSDKIEMTRGLGGPRVNARLAREGSGRGVCAPVYSTKPGRCTNVPGVGMIFLRALAKVRSELFFVFSFNSLRARVATLTLEVF